MPHLLILHGPNLGLLGSREPKVYGTMTQDELIRSVSDRAAHLGWESDFIQSNHEGVLIDAILDAPGRYDAILLNPSALTHTSIALRDAVGAVPVPVVEVHLSNVHAREPYRRVSYVAETAAATVSGAGLDSYLAALTILESRHRGVNA
ncbi:type II 3-dehydroquinate dehydratase [Microbacterium sp. NPDC078428]|uniref:type II 3-dehydroquinate dehydratase n=1 Tax=Microbacterium sp. NPDC078428 TaxID=3364190 RepID=UPI0037C5DB29